MTKVLLRSFVLVCSLMLLQSTKSLAQPYCPMGVFNNNQYIGLANEYVYNTFVDGDYQLTLFSTEFPCFLDNQLVHFTRTTNVSNYIAGAPAVAGVVISLSGSACAGLTNNVLQTGGVSLIAVRPSDGLRFLVLNYWDNLLDECSYVPLPVFFVSSSADYDNNGGYTKIRWTTNDESDMDHFTVEKTTFATGSSWVKVAHIAAQNIQVANYQWNDYNPIYKGYYRIIGVDNNCKKTYSRVIADVCQTCPATFSPPSSTPDCYSPTTGPYISGPGSICNTSPKLYRLTNVSGEATTTWSLAPSNLGTLIQASRMVQVTPSGTPGVATLTATVVKNGQTRTYSTEIVLGIPPLYVSITNTAYPDMGEGVVQHEATVVNTFPGASYSSFAWYENGLYIGNVPYFAWFLMPGQTINYQVKWNGPCGQSVYNGSYTPPPYYGYRMAPGYTVSPNPAKGGKINISLQKPGSIVPDRQHTLKIFSPVKTIEIQVYDMYGNFRKSVKVRPGDNRLTVDAPELPTGLYYLHVMEPGQKPVKLKVWIEK